MAIINRVKRLFRADFHAVLDAIEEPEAILKQAIRDMEDSLDQKRSRLASRQRALEALSLSEESIKKRVAAAEEDLELCMKEGSEELARKTIARKLSLQRRLAATQRRSRLQTRACTQLGLAVENQQKQLAEVLEKARLFVPIAREDDPAEVAESVLSAPARWGQSSFTGSEMMRVSDEEVELEWVRVRDRFRQGGES